MLAIALKEIKSYLNSMIAYVVIGVFLIAMGLIVWVFPETSILTYGFAEMDVFFSMAPYLFMFLIPAITMKSIAEEKQNGTLEILLTKPLTDWQIVLGKYLASWFLVLIALLPTLVYYYAVYQLASPVGNVDSAGIIGSYLGLSLLGAVFAAIGLFSSSITDSQIIAFVIGVFISFFLYYGFSAIASLNVWGKSSILIEELGITYHYNYMGKGLIDTRDLMYFITLTVFMLMSTKLVLSARKW